MIDLQLTSTPGKRKLDDSDLLDLVTVFGEVSDEEIPSLESLFETCGAGTLFSDDFTDVTTDTGDSYNEDIEDRDPCESLQSFQRPHSRKVKKRRTKRHGKRDRDALSDAAIKKALIYKCSSNCMDKFMYGTILKKRQELRNDVTGSQNEFLMSQIIAVYSYHEDRARDVSFTLDGHNICQKCWRNVFGVSDARYYRLLTKVKAGNVLPTPDGRHGRHYDTAAFLEAKIWLTRFSKSYGDHMPHRSEIQLPSCFTKKQIWEQYQAEHDDDDIPVIGYSRFLELWNEHFRHMKIPKCKDFSKCKDCVNYQEALAKGPSKEELKEIKEELSVHLDLQRLARETYYWHISKARHNPNKYISVIIDNMDQQKTNLPTFPTQSKVDAGLAHVKHQITGVLDHGNKAAFGFVWDNALSGDCNMTCTVLLEVLHTIAQQHGGKLPEVLYVQGDNSPKDNKNVTVLYFLAYLVQRQIVKKVKMSFLMVGHTHEDVDQMFSRFSRALKHTAAPTVSTLIDVLAPAYTPRPTVSHLQGVWDFRSFFGQCKGLSGHQSPHVFKMYLKDNVVTMAYKDWPLPTEDYRELPLDLKVQPTLTPVERRSGAVEQLKEGMLKDLPKWEQAARLTEQECQEWKTYLQSLGETVTPKVTFDDFQCYQPAPAQERRLPERLKAALQKSMDKLTKQSHVTLVNRRR